MEVRQRPRSGDALNFVITYDDGTEGRFCLWLSDKDPDGSARLPQAVAELMRRHDAIKARTAQTTPHKNSLAG